MADKRTEQDRSGFTLVETAVGMVTAAVLTLGVLMFMADNQRAFNDSYNSAFCPAAEDRTTARIVFQNTVRRASSSGGATVADDGTWIEVLYYSDPNVSTPDRTAGFHLFGQDLLLSKSVTDTGEIVSLDTVCSNVASVHFDVTGGAVRMYLELDDGSSARTLHTSAVMRSP